MASKTAKAAIGGAHTAGIFADMTVDGPEIGTLVVIVDRAKNLPNRKSMGKQDPYCAARLGKEAKKTETDKRGGQTPKWDQELRFTVHDSPDYYQLKVSVFNDDRKTELIGETWVSLQETIVPGGGKQDKWHHLNCKGRFAGEIRIELTYYDTRPKEPRAEEHRQNSISNSVEDSHKDNSPTVGGPRQPKPITRRPLPSNPTLVDSARSSPQPFTPPPATQQLPNTPQESSTPSDPYWDNAPLIDTRPCPSDQTQYQESSHAINGYGIPLNQAPRHDEHTGTIDRTGRSQFNSSSHRPDHYMQESPGLPQISTSPSYSDDRSLGQSYQPQGYMKNEYSNSQPSQARYDTPPAMPMKDGYTMSKVGSSSSLPQHVSMPEFGMRQEQIAPIQKHHRTSLPRTNNYDANPRHYALEGGSDSYSSQFEPMDDEAPPPPPIHRSSGLQTPPQSQRKSQADSYPPVSGPAPLNIRHARNSISASPLSQVHNSLPHPDHGYSTSPVAARRLPQSYQSTSPHHSYSSPERRQSPEHIQVPPTRDHSQPTPPSLVPGYNPNLVGNEPQRPIYDSQQSCVRQYSEPSPQYQAFATQRDQTSAQPSPRNDVPLQLRMLGNGHERRPHRASAPVMPRREVSPDTRTPIRKSVSPQPEIKPGERRQSAVPFGPDSYDAFNPSLNDAASVNFAGPKYDTPEQANEAQYERAKEAKLAEGPIIGSDGREIDPSDHLPAETWAPEPESKAPKKKPEITVRFRRSPAGAQPMPTAARRPTEPSARPGPIVTPGYAHSSDAISPTSAARNRLQKKTRTAIAQPMSSPAVPTVNTNISSMPRAASEHPLREYENYGYNRSPIYFRNSPGGVPPPIPGKVPLSAGAGQEDWGMDALSEEMRRIDIGVGAGSGRGRRYRYGASESGQY